MRYPFAREYPVTQEFGDNPGGYAKFNMLAHNGIDFGAPAGTNVFAVAEGVVERATFDEGGYGFYVQVKHSDGLTSVYAHLSQIRVQPGVTVKAGQLLGQSGTTGNSTGPHLHFEVRRQGLESNGYHGAIDPRPLIVWPGQQPVGPSVVYMVKVAQLNVRSGPGLNHPIIGAAHMGNELQVVDVITPEIWGRLVDGRYVALEYQGNQLAVKKG